MNAQSKQMMLEEIFNTLITSCQKTTKSEVALASALDAVVKAAFADLMEKFNCDALSRIAPIMEAHGQKARAKKVFDALSSKIKEIGIAGIIPAPRTKTFACEPREIKSWLDSKENKEKVISLPAFSKWETKTATEKSPERQAREAATKLARVIQQNGLQISPYWKKILDSIEE